MRAPKFWIKGGPLSVLLAPLGWGWEMASAWRGAFVKPFVAPIPVICIGNLVAGGAGKTPVALSVARRIAGVHFLSRGYGGEENGPILVDPRKHDHRRVGDEPLLLAEVAPCWVARDRVQGAQAAAAHGARAIVMDDGYQNPSLHKDLSLLIVDGHTGFGSGRCIPAGPLREPVARAVGRAGAAVILGEDRRGVAKLLGDLPILHAKLEPEVEAAALVGQRVVAFAGIGRPEKFFHSLRALGAKVIESYSFPDHHPYHPNEIGELHAIAEKHSAGLITTTKDFVRVPAHMRETIAVLRVGVTWDDETALMEVLSRALRDPALS